MRNRNLRQGINITFRVKLGSVQTKRVQCCLRDMSQCEKSSVFAWHKWFTEGEGMVKDTEKTRLSQKSETLRKCSKVRHLIPSDSRLNIREVVQERNLGKERETQNLRDDLCTKQVPRRWSPLLLIDAQK